ncbi:MAG: signal peptidase II [Candidatus Sericytochromatia bacterium]
MALVDQATKHLIRERLAIAQDWPVFPGFTLTHVTNQGGALSLLHGHVGLLSAVSMAVIAGLVIVERRRKRLPRWQTAALGILLGGTVGNLVDRLVFGRVTDFLDVYVGEWHFPTFNVADIAINAGVAILAYKTWLAPPIRQDPDSQEEPPR